MTHFRQICQVAFTSFFAFSGTSVLAHEMFSSSELPAEGLAVNTTLAATYRSDSVVDNGEVWNIPGVLMGGEALPFDDDLSLDEAFITGSYRQNNTYGIVKFGQHGSGHDMAIEHAIVGYQVTPYLIIEAGKLPAAFSTRNGKHASDTAFSNKTLVHDAFWGRQYNDEGIRAKLFENEWGIHGGVEYWKGNAFPGARKGDNGGAFDSYLRIKRQLSNWALMTGIFGVVADAYSREDERYSLEHSHGVSTDTIAEYSYDGETDMYGIEASIWYSLNDDLAMGIHGEWVHFESEGELRDSNRLAPLESEHDGFWLEAAASWKSHQLAIRHELLQLKNDIYGSGAEILATQAGLINGGEDPSRATLSYNFMVNTTLKLRAEWQREHSTLEEVERFMLGVVWSADLL